MMTQPIQMFENLTSETSPAGGNDIAKTSLTFEERRMLELRARYARAELVGKTLLGLRVDDVISAVNFMQGSTTGDPNQITAQASGHLGLVLLHAAVLDPRLKHITVDHTIQSYRSLIEVPMPIDAPEDILPGVVRRYDIPDLVRELGPRLTFNDPLSRHKEPQHEPL